MSVLVLLEHAEGAIKEASLSAVTAGSQLGEVTALVVGSGDQAAADAAAAIAGVSKVLYADDASLANGLVEATAHTLSKASAGYSHILAGATNFGKAVIPFAAALNDVQAISDISAIIDADTFERPIYAGNAISTVQSSDAIKFVSVRATSFDPAATEGGAAAVESLDAAANPGTAEYVGDQLTESERPELTSAKIVVSGGRGMQNGDNFAMLETMADKLNAAVGASRAAVDAGFVPNDYQVGQTGKVVAPDLYIAVGISGAIQHLAGMKDSKVIVAVNKDDEAPIFQVADYGLVADLFDAVPAMNDAM